MPRPPRRSSGRRRGSGTRAGRPRTGGCAGRDGARGSRRSGSSSPSASSDVQVGMRAPRRRAAGRRGARRRTPAPPAASRRPRARGRGTRAPGRRRARPRADASPRPARGCQRSWSRISAATSATAERPSITTYRSGNRAASARYASADARPELVALALDPVALSPIRAERGVDVDLHEERQVGKQAADGGQVQREHLLDPEPAARPW